MRAWYRGRHRARSRNGWSRSARAPGRSSPTRSSASACSRAPRSRRGAIFLAGWLTILAGTLDILDGGVARRGGRRRARGARSIDSVVDRWAEFATFVGLGAFFRDSWMLAVVAVAAFASQMVSYVRAPGPRVSGSP